MQRIHHVSSYPTLPAPVVSGDPGYFVEGEAGGTDPTYVTATWANSVQEEIVTVIDEAAIELDVTDNTQLLDAINYLIDVKVNAALDKAFPLGSILMHTAEEELDGFMYPDGRAISRTTYAAYFAKVGTTYGAGNGTTTFNIPDWRGKFPRAFNDQAASGYDYARVFGTTQTQSLKSHTHTASSVANGYHYHNGAAVANCGAMSVQSTSSLGVHNHQMPSAVRIPVQNIPEPASWKCVVNFAGSEGMGYTLNSASLAHTHWTTVPEHGHTLYIPWDGQHTHTITVDSTGDTSRE